MAGEDVLDLDRMDVLAAGDDHVVQPPVDPQVAVGVEVPGVAGVVPAVANRLGVGVGPVPVAGERLVAREVRADLPTRLELQARIDGGPSRAPRLAGLVAADRERVDLGRAVVVDEHLGIEDLEAPRHDGGGHRRAGVAERPDAREIVLAEPVVADEVVEEGRNEVQRGDAFLLDQAQRLGRVPASLRDVATADEMHREKRMDPHRVVQGHHAEGAVAVLVPVLQRLTESAGPVGGVTAGDALGPAGRAGGVEEERDLALVAIERALVHGAVGERIAVANHDLGARVVDAVRELLLREAPREGNEHGPGPLRRPVEERRLDPVVEDDGDPRSLLRPEPAGEARNPRHQLAVADPGECLELRMSLAGGEEGLGQVHRSRPFGSCQVVTSLLDRGDDRRVPGAAAEVPGEHVHDLLAGRCSAGEQIVGGDQDARRAEAALQRMVVLEGGLER